jgi:hypothetical protein
VLSRFVDRKHLVVLDVDSLKRQWLEAP